MRTLMARRHAQAWRRRVTVELLVKGRALSEVTKAFSQPHHFERSNYTTAAYCDYCTHVLWGLLKTGTLSCHLRLIEPLTLPRHFHRLQWLECLGTQHNEVPAPLITGK